MFVLLTALSIAAAPAAAPQPAPDHSGHQGMEHKEMKHEGPCCDAEAKKDCCKGDKPMPCCEKKKADAPTAETPAQHAHAH